MPAVVNKSDAPLDVPLVRWGAFQPGEPVEVTDEQASVLLANPHFALADPPSAPPADVSAAEAELAKAQADLAAAESKEQPQ